MKRFSPKIIIIQVPSAQCNYYYYFFPKHFCATKQNFWRKKKTQIYNQGKKKKTPTHLASTDFPETKYFETLYDDILFVVFLMPGRHFNRRQKKIKLKKYQKKNLPLARAMVHSIGSTVNNRPSYRISAFDIKLILEPSSGIPVDILEI